MTRPGFEPGPPRWEAGDLPPELWRGLSFTLWLYDNLNSSSPVFGQFPSYVGPQAPLQTDSYSLIVVRLVPLVSSLCTGAESENSGFIAVNLSRFLLCYIHEAAYK
jgi:hypothetical protein